MSKIVPHLWYDTQALEAAQFYVSLFSGSRVVSRTSIPDTPSGTAELVRAELAGQEFMLLSAGPGFTFTPAISFSVACSSPHEADRLWAKLSDGGEALMPLGAYPFAERFGWVNDLYGLSWQLLYNGQPSTQKITPALLFVGKQCGRAEEAASFYTSVLGGSIGNTLRYGTDEKPDRAGTVKQMSLALAGQNFTVMDSAHPHDFGFNQAISLLVHCEDQPEIDTLWGRLSADPQEESCGWLKDRFGVSWQISPRKMQDWISDADPVRHSRLIAVMLKMKKLDMAALEKARGS